ncbi:hypothetical protein N7462_004632 [Penicillium macrosclerotiorum]|uniref:uncharacterized protein n=1 Tax=Penicillium macrosclerotiorum TaxID=303699 RepID=UPI0025474A48|nr:uncharacterized protein N7462_004632 [Penicillium macrosclerotiorum]KAJ5690240.1 hypothetical protein N7462_004632 [Penicillium macrosclerotiorum]
MGEGLKVCQAQGGASVASVASLGGSLARVTGRLQAGLAGYCVGTVSVPLRTATGLWATAETRQ